MKGVRGGQISGVAVVSFNLEAFDSYGKSQPVNASVCEQAAFQYYTALNCLLAYRSRCIRIGETTAVL